VVQRRPSDVRDVIGRWCSDFENAGIYGMPELEELFAYRGMDYYIASRSIIHQDPSTSIDWFVEVKGILSFSLCFLCRQRRPMSN
jgi:hypothetical protein